MFPNPQLFTQQNTFPFSFPDFQAQKTPTALFGAKPGFLPTQLQLPFLAQMMLPFASLPVFPDTNMLSLLQNQKQENLNFGKEVSNQPPMNKNSNKRTFDTMMAQSAKDFKHKKSIDENSQLTPNSRSKKENELETQCSPASSNKDSTKSQEGSLGSEPAVGVTEVIKESVQSPKKREGEEWKILSANFNQAKQELIFTVECTLAHQERRYRYLTKKQILKEDPMLIVYFYENQFEFESTELKKL